MTTADSLPARSVPACIPLVSTTACGRDPRQVTAVACDQRVHGAADPGERRRQEQQAPKHAPDPAAGQQHCPDGTVASQAPPARVDPPRCVGRLLAGHTNPLEIRLLPRQHDDRPPQPLDSPPGRQCTEASVAIEQQHRRVCLSHNGSLPVPRAQPGRPRSRSPRVTHDHAAIDRQPGRPVRTRPRVPGRPDGQRWVLPDIVAARDVA